MTGTAEAYLMTHFLWTIRLSKKFPLESIDGANVRSAEDPQKICLAVGRLPSCFDWAVVIRSDNSGR